MIKSRDFDFLYHRTTMRYHDKCLKEFGNYRLEGNRICLAREPFTPWGYAQQRAKQYKDQPLILIVNPELLDKEADLVLNPLLSVERLKRNNYGILKLPKSLNRKSMIRDTLEEINELKELVFRLD